MTELIEINAYPVKNVLSRLLLDKTTGKNIIFATDDYARYVTIQIRLQKMHCLGLIRLIFNLV